MSDIFLWISMTWVFVQLPRWAKFEVSDFIFQIRLVVLQKLQEQLIYEIKKIFPNTKGSPCPILRFFSHAADGKISAVVVVSSNSTDFPHLLGPHLMARKIDPAILQNSPNCKNCFDGYTTLPLKLDVTLHWMNRSQQTIVDVFQGFG